MFKKTFVFPLIVVVAAISALSVITSFTVFLQNTPLYPNAQITQQTHPKFHPYYYTSQQPNSISFMLNISSTLVFVTSDSKNQVERWYAQRGWKWGCIDCGGRTEWWSWDLGSFLSLGTYRTLRLSPTSIDRQVVVRMTIPLP